MDEFNQREYSAGYRAGEEDISFLGMQRAKECAKYHGDTWYGKGYRAAIGVHEERLAN